MQHTATKVTRHAKAHGLGATIKAAIQRLLHGPQTLPEGNPPESAGAAPPPPASILQPRKIDVIGFYNDILAHEHGSVEELDAANPDEDTLQWVIPNFGFGSGGHLNIFRFINNLADQGFKQRLVILPPYDWASAEKAAAAIEEWYFPLKAEVALGVEGFAPAHATIATGWQTAYWVAKYQATRDRFYFVQDFEPAFYAVSSEYFFAENTYRLGLKGITAGTWLSEKLSKDYGMTCGDVSFSCNMDVYKPGERREEANFNLLFYSRHVTKRRLFELGIIALEKVCKAHPEVTVIFAGGDVGGFEVPFSHLNGGEMKLSDLPDLYVQCDLSLCLSATNLSLLPLELAATKCPIVMNDSPSSRWLLNGNQAFFAPPDPDGMADTIIKAIEDEKLRKRKAEAAYKVVQATSWQAEAEKAAELLRTL